jgi:hypothetical protein
LFDRVKMAGQPSNGPCLLYDIAMFHSELAGQPIQAALKISLQTGAIAGWGQI